MSIAEGFKCHRVVTDDKSSLYSTASRCPSLLLMHNGGRVNNRSSVLIAAIQMNQMVFAAPEKERRTGSISALVNVLY